MPDKAIISHRGEKYEIGRGRRFYGIWVAGAPYDAPVDRWPETRDGWEQAWARFAAIETPGTIVAVPRQGRSLPWPRRGRGSSGAAGDTVRASARHDASMLLAGQGLLVLGVVLGIAGLFPAYTGGQSLLSVSYELVAHLSYVLAWAVSAGLVALGAARPGTARLGALLGLGVGVVTLGMFLADLGEVTSGRPSGGIGLTVSLIGWAACTAGSALAVAAARGDKPAGSGAQPAGSGAQPVASGPGGTGLAGSGQAWPGRSRPRRGIAHAGPFALLLLAGIGTAAAFAPSWDSFTLSASSTGAAQTIILGNAFDNPGMVIAGNVAVMVAVAAVAAVAAIWRPARQGALLLAGAVVPLAAQAVSALIQAAQPATPRMFGFTPAQAKAIGLTITSGVTPIFWVYCVFVFSLLVSCAWLFTAPGDPALSPVPAPWPPAAHGSADDDAAHAAPGAAENSAGESDVPGGDAAASENGPANSDPGASEDPGNERPEDQRAESGDSGEGGAQSAYA